MDMNGDIEIKSKTLKIVMVLGVAVCCLYKGIEQAQWIVVGWSTAICVALILLLLRYGE